MKSDYRCVTIVGNFRDGVCVDRQGGGRSYLHRTRLSFLSLCITIFAISQAIDGCYLGRSLSKVELDTLYATASSGDRQKRKFHTNKLDRFDVDALVDVASREEILSCFVPMQIVQCIIELELSETQTVVECKAKLISNALPASLALPMNCCRDIALLSGGYCWDGAFWCVTNERRPLHKFAHMDRVVFYCGNRDVIYCKADEFCHGPRFANAESELILYMMCVEP